MHLTHPDTPRTPAGSGRTRPGPRAAPAGPCRGVGRAAAAAHLVLVVLDDSHRHPRDLVLLITIHHTEIRPAPAPRSRPQSQRPSGNRSRRSPGFSVQARYTPGAPGCLPRFRVTPPRRFGFTAGGVLPGSSSFRRRPSRRITAVAREQWLQLRQPQPRVPRCVGPERGDLLGPSREKRDQLLTRHLLPAQSHAKITTAPPRQHQAATRRSHSRLISNNSHIGR